jgi:hypothetical protein
MFFVEEDYARRYRLANDLMLPFFAVAFGVGLWSERSRFARWWQSRGSKQ